MRLGRFLGFGDGLRLLLRLSLGSELLLHLERDGVRIHLVGLRRGAEGFAAVRLRSVCFFRPPSRLAPGRESVTYKMLFVHDQYT